MDAKMAVSQSSMTSTTLETKLQAALRRRERVGTLRTLQTQDDACIDFFSNDYLGFARSKELQDRIHSRREELKTTKPRLMQVGSTGSRLISGNHAFFTQVESELAAFYGCEAALLFNSGYAANLGVLSSLPGASDVVLYDELVHNSCHEGLRLSRAYANQNTFAFQHNSLEHLEIQLKRLHEQQNSSPRCVFVVVESIYSMDGDVAPLTEMTALCERFGAYLIVDEAHGVGVYGPHGSGVVRELGLDQKSHVICCRVYTFGKAMGTHGAVVCGSQVLVDYLVNYARSFIYTTSCPVDQLVSIQCAHEYCAQADPQRSRVKELVRYFKRSVEKSAEIPSAALLQSDSPIQGVVFAGNHAVLDAAKQMRALGIRVIPIRSPTVPKGSERFRIIIHADNTEAEIDQLVHALVVLFRQASLVHKAKL
ncbi:hypothetical protein Poli38472_010338 [Pythium oligandrum]|uniref:Aminotransferase class I/classII large domain-containing protein n=1 Tax=Pythium oligandrum TaxID=41045 RepID=A0A8K1FAV4_PYTOL|nr:hypothetical protein Poli38472_010338 [Pythium oligandrum]|eukprot:TMW55456.1 hypothetical protein Poli38472_010338 [Pythium oligandrum]